jgi:hypothetical protein
MALLVHMYVCMYAFVCVPALSVCMYVCADCRSICMRVCVACMYVYMYAQLLCLYACVSALIAPYGTLPLYSIASSQVTYTYLLSNRLEAIDADYA